jgi:flagellar biosynthesis protein FlhG
MANSGDQADGLRRLQQARGPKVLAVTGGKGGVGKTSVSVNLALAMAQMGKSTLLLDADLGLANVDVLLGLYPEANLSHVLSGQVDLADIIIEGPGGLKILPAASGVSDLAALSPQAQSGLISAFSSLPFSLDLMVIDTAAGIDSSVMLFCQAAHEVVVVVCDEPASITDAYALIKVLSRERGVRRFQVLANRVRDQQQGRMLYHKLLAVCDKFLDVSLSYFGAVPEDGSAVRASRQQRALVDAFPSSPAARALQELARRADSWPMPGSDGGRPSFFSDRQVTVPARDTAVMAG